VGKAVAGKMKVLKKLPSHKNCVTYQISARPSQMLWLGFLGHHRVSESNKVALPVNAKYNGFQ
jgi:hypothetical protein